ncbi:MAG: CheB methylesterase domain-containing protein [ANME-2 cluster archaeon]|nr:CheB methylesterase domain-containing protein [ANME-2 cluster archaeon]
MISVVVIGASTGGPTVLKNIIPKLPHDFPVPIVVIQHIIANFSKQLAQTLQNKSVIIVKEGEHMEMLKPGIVYIAPTEKHLTIKHGRIILKDSPPRHHVKPSIDITMESAALEYGDQSIAVVLTGAGADGTKGIEAIKNAGGITIAQSKHSCIAKDMPRNAIESGHVDYVLSPEAITDKLIELVNSQ